MKSFYIILVSSLLSVHGIAQNSTNLPVDTTDLSTLIDLALENNPLVKQNKIELEKLEMQRNYVNNNWLNLFTISGNLNELSLKQTLGETENTNNQFFPRYNFGVFLRLGAVSEIGQQKKLFTKDIQAAIEKNEFSRGEIENEVKQLYYNYLMNREKFYLKRSFQELATASFNTTEKRFSEGDVELNDFYQAREDYFNFRLDVLNAEEAYLRAKANLELMIGVTLESLNLASSSNTTAPIRD